MFKTERLLNIHNEQFHETVRPHKRLQNGCSHEASTPADLKKHVKEVHHKIKDLEYPQHDNCLETAHGPHANQNVEPCRESCTNMPSTDAHTTPIIIVIYNHTSEIAPEIEIAGEIEIASEIAS